jgi:hypothetical protein
VAELGEAGGADEADPANADHADRGLIGHVLRLSTGRAGA